MASTHVHEAPGALPCGHIVQVYREGMELAEAVAVFLSAGFARDEPAVAVVTAAHLPLITARLEKRGHDVGALESSGLLFTADAEVTLAAISEDGVPSGQRFVEIIGGLLDRADAARPGRKVRVFGEMVDLLCRRGEEDNAEVLERLWNRLGERRSFSLLCGYKIDVFDRRVQTALLPRIYRSHSEVLPAPEPERMERAVDAALSEVLGADAEKVYARAGDRDQIPRPEAALLWVSAHMPRTAERVLASARTHYGAEPASAGR